MTSKPSTSSPATHSTMHAPPQKDFAAAFGALQSQYGFGGIPTPPLPETDSNTRKWYKWGASRSSSTASLIRPTTRSDATPPPSRPAMSTQGTLSESELRFGNVMAEYGHGPVSHANSNYK